MSRAFNEAVRTLFTTGMHRFSSLTYVGVAPESPYPGERAWRSDGATCTAWLSLITSPKGRNEFIVEIGWSRLRRYPRLTMRPSIFGTPSNQDFQERDEAFFRLHPSSGKKSDWWHVAMSESASLKGLGLMAQLARDKTRAMDAGEAAALVQPLVEDALAVVEAVGIAAIERAASL